MNTDKLEELKSAILPVPKPTIAVMVRWTDQEIPIKTGDAEEAVGSVRARVESGEIKAEDYEVDTTFEGYDRKEVADYFASALPYLKELYRRAGYEDAIRLQEEIESLLGKLDKPSSIFDDGTIGNTAANCFHSGTWQIWHGDNECPYYFFEYNDEDLRPDEYLAQNYEYLTAYIGEFVTKAEEYLKELKELG